MKQVKSLSQCLHTQKYESFFSFSFFASKTECQFELVLKANLVLLPSSPLRSIFGTGIWLHSLALQATALLQAQNGSLSVSPAPSPRSWKVPALASVTCTQVLLPFSSLQPPGRWGHPDCGLIFSDILALPTFRPSRSQRQELPIILISCLQTPKLTLLSWVDWL